MDKMRGPIRQITINSATFENCAVDLNYLNFFFGRNGAGKSTIARTLGSGHGLTWDPTVDANDHSVMVYDRGFVDENFSTYDSLDGVFTLGKANIEAEKKLAGLRQDRDEHTHIAKQHEDDASAKQAQLEQLTANFYNECWKKSKNLRDQFPETQNGRKRKHTFAEAVLYTADPKEHDLSELETLYTAAFDKQATTYPLLGLVDIQLPDDHLMGAAIVNTANTDFARFIVVDTSAVKEQINTVLRESGFQGFHLDDVPGKDNTYCVVRLDGSTAENLSEGERNFIAFLYFYFLIQGSLEQAEDPRNKIVVINDPVSSMDSGAMFIVAAHVRELVSICQNNVDYRHDTRRGNHVKQIIILSHNPYFYREVSYPNLNDYRYASYFLIKKTDNVSRVNLCVRNRQDAPSQKESYTPALNSYAALWNEYKEASSSTTLLSVTRRILEHYFLQLCGYDSADLTMTLLKNHRDKFIRTNAQGQEDLADYHLVTSMLTYISHHKSGLEDDTYLIAEDHDPNQLRHIFQLIFTLMGQEQHCKMMNGGHRLTQIDKLIDGSRNK